LILTRIGPGSDRSSEAVFALSAAKSTTNPGHFRRRQAYDQI
jgi:hypothetical protein